MNLQKLQGLFFDAMANGNLHLEILDLIEPAGSLKNSKDAMAVYQRAYRARQTEALGETFDAVWSILGDDAFFVVAEKYTQRYPSQSYNLSSFGDQFSNFLKNETQLYEEIPFLYELADFEWLFQKSFHTKRDTRQSKLVNINEFSVFSFPENAFFLNTQYDVNYIWENREKLGSIEVSLKPDPAEWSFFRNANGFVQIQKWSPWQMRVIEDLFKGKPLKDSLNSLDDVTEKNVSEFFTILSQSGFAIPRNS